MVYHWTRSRLEYLEEEDLEREVSPCGGGSLHRLVLGRAIDLAKSTPEYGVRNRCKSCLFDICIFYIEITIERGL